MSAASRVRCPACGRLLRGARGLRAHAAAADKRHAAACVFEAGRAATKLAAAELPATT